MKKSRIAFYGISIAAGTPVPVTLLTGLHEVCLISCAVFLIFMLWWSLYFHYLDYSYRNNEFYIKSGWIFSKLRVICSENILWVMKLKIPFSKETILSVIHTSGGNIVILADFLTDS